MLYFKYLIHSKSFALPLKDIFYLIFKIKVVLIIIAHLFTKLKRVNFLRKVFVLK